ncbi:hypothetical protein [Riemerella columbina]|uniref:hypothetical protein n=1 Tax=Riemerella columbina TaxID=103810 RepID=UPI0026701882|nr:hypothetical protein [Riemerella columbina]WKS94717.1 hypothetical protein NYR17_07225 [Riemerella columbina]
MIKTRPYQKTLSAVLSAWYVLFLLLLSVLHQHKDAPNLDDPYHKVWSKASFKSKTTVSADDCLVCHFFGAAYSLVPEKLEVKPQYFEAFSEGFAKMSLSVWVSEPIYFSLRAPPFLS